MENAAMFTALRAESAKVKKELEDLRREVRSTYLSKNVPSNVTLKNNAVDESSKSDPNSIPKTKTPSEVNPKKPIDLLIPQTQVPERLILLKSNVKPPTILPAVPQVPTMAAMVARNAPQTGKTVDWTTVTRKGSKKEINTKGTWPAPLKNVEESKRRVIFIRKEGLQGKSPSTAQDILHAINMRLLSLKAPAHFRLTKLRYNEGGNLTGLTTPQTTADAMISRVKEEILKTVLRFDADVTEITVNQQWIHLKAHGVELGRYCSPNGLNQLREEISAGPSALELPFVPRWVSGQENLLNMARNGLKFHSSIWFTVKTQAEADRAIRQGIHFGGKFHKVEKYLRVGPDTLCPTCCHWGHTIYGCPTPEKKRCAICAEPHVTTEH